MVAAPSDVSPTLTWVVRDALPESEGQDLWFDPAALPPRPTLDELKHWCETEPDAVGFAYWPWYGQWLPKRKGTGFVEEGAEWTQKLAPQKWQWYYLKERAVATDAPQWGLAADARPPVSSRGPPADPHERAAGTVALGTLVNQRGVGGLEGSSFVSKDQAAQARVKTHVRDLSLALFSDDNARQRYSSLANDGSQGPEAREAAMLFSAAETHLDEEDSMEALKAGKDALDIYRKIGDGKAGADTLRVIVNVHRQMGEVDNNPEERDAAKRIATDELKAFRDAGERYGEAVMLMTLSEATAFECGSKKDNTAIQSAIDARLIFQELGSKKMEGLSMLALASAYIQACTKSQATPDLEKAADVAKDARALFQELQDRHGEAKSLHAQAVAFNSMEMYDDAIQCAKESLALWRELGVRKHEAFACYCIAQWNLLNKNPQDGLKLAERALTIVSDMDKKKRWESAVLCLVVRAHLDLGDMEAASRTAKDGVRSFRTLRDRPGEAALTEALVAVHIEKDDKAEALSTAESAIEVIQSIKNRDSKDRLWEAHLLHTICQLHLYSGKFEKANVAGQSALKLAKDFGEPIEQAVLMNTLTHVRMALSDFAEAQRLASKARDIFKEYGPRPCEAAALMSLAGAYMGRGDLVRAVRALVEAQSIQVKDGRIQGEASALEMLSFAYSMDGDHQKAISTAKRARDLQKDAGSLKGQAAAALQVCEASFMAGLQEGLQDPRSEVSPAWEKALQAAKEAQTLAKKLENSYFVAHALYQVASVQVMTRNPDAAVTIAEATDVFTALEDKRGEGYLKLLLGQNSATNDRIDAASTAFSAALALFKEIEDPLGEAEAEELIAAFAGHGGGGGEEGEGGASGEYMGPTPEMLAATVTDVALSLMGVESLAQDTPLMDAGMDSLASVEFQNTLQKEFVGVNLPSTLIFDFPSVKTLTDFVYSGLKEAAGGGAAIKG